MGRSVAQFFLKEAAPDGVLQASIGFGAGERLGVADMSPNHVTLRAGNEWVAGKKVVRVSVWPAEGGATVQVEAWWEGVPGGR